jgi:hypothetical protein
MFWSADFSTSNGVAKSFRFISVGLGLATIVPFAGSGVMIDVTPHGVSLRKQEESNH